MAPFGTTFPRARQFPRVECISRPASGDTASPWVDHDERILLLVTRRISHLKGEAHVLLVRITIPILSRHWALDAQGSFTRKIIEYMQSSTDDTHSALLEAVPTGLDPMSHTKHDMHRTAANRPGLFPLKQLPGSMPAAVSRSTGHADLSPLTNLP